MNEKKMVDIAVGDIVHNRGHSLYKTTTQFDTALISEPKEKAKVVADISAFLTESIESVDDLNQVRPGLARILMYLTNVVSGSDTVAID